MKILLYHWASYYEDDIQNILREEGVTFDILAWTFKDKNEDDAFLAHISRNVSLEQYDLLFSVNYWPLLSIVCKNANIPYIAWCYDNPLNVRDIHLTLGNENNHVYCFDKMQVAGYRKQGFQTVHHLPLGVNAKRLKRISPSDPKCARFQSQVSFVGKLYESAIQIIMAGADEYCKGYLQALIEAQRELYGAYILADGVTDDLLQKLNKSIREKAPDSSLILHRDEVSFALACETTRRDRLILLSLLGTRFQTKFYSYNDSSILKGVEKRAAVDYQKEMPYVFAASKINLNPSLRAIQTGIPLRALDIMACGGFLLSNYQEELAESFLQGEEMVCYESLPDAVDQVQYYLSHDEERAKIALRGRLKTLQDYDMRDRLKTMLTCFSS